MSLSIILVSVIIFRGFWGILDMFTPRDELLYLVISLMGGLICVAVILFYIHKPEK
jgi:hypothetical protein